MAVIGDPSVLPDGPTFIQLASSTELAALLDRDVAEGNIDLVVVGREATLTHDERELVHQRGLGFLDLIEEPTPSSPSTDVVVDLHPRSGGQRRLPIRPSLPPNFMRPVGYDRDDSARLVVLGTPAGPEWDAISDQIHTESVSEAMLQAPRGYRDPCSQQDPEAAETWKHIAKNSVGVAIGKLSAPITRAGAARLIWLAGRGVPIVSTDPKNLALRFLDPAVVELIVQTSWDDLLDPIARDGVSVRFQQLAHRLHSSWGVWDSLLTGLDIRVPSLPRVSVLFCTKRTDFLERALSLLARQTYPNLEVVLVLHGEFPTETDAHAHLDRLPEAMGRKLVSVPSRIPFGDALNAGLEAASGTLISKWDDDDWYSAEHIWDLVLAAEHSSAELVGKGAEFVYLSDLDITIRRQRRRAHRTTHLIAGGTLLIHRHVLEALGGWRKSTAAVDQLLIGGVRDSGGETYRSHGFGYVLNRHNEYHTWDVDSAYFLRQAGQELSGLALRDALVEGS